MTYATRSSLHARSSKPRNSSSNNGRIVLKALTGGFAAVVLVLMTVMAVITGAGWLLAVSLRAQSDIRFVVAVAPPPGRLVRSGAPAGETAGQTVVVESFSLPATVRSTRTPVLDPVGALALVIPGSSDAGANPSDDQIFTGSLRAPSAKLASLDVAPLGQPGAAAKLVDPPQPPLPRARPRFAALPPIDDPAMKPEEDAQPLRTAIYDISAQVVYLPSGERLEAHSGLGDLMDDPRFVRRKNRGATPPNTYELKLRESLFHGVQAIRLTPVGDGDMFDRDGILAHSYMLGASGQSNGCVSFKDYPKFLRAYLRGEVDRMVVVSRLTKPPVFVTRRNARSAANTL
jgi:hypothetical protein